MLDPAACHPRATRDPPARPPARPPAEGGLRTCRPREQLGFEALQPVYPPIAHTLGDRALPGRSHACPHTPNWPAFPAAAGTSPAVLAPRALPCRKGAAYSAPGSNKGSGRTSNT